MGTPYVCDIPNNYQTQILWSTATNNCTLIMWSPVASASCQNCVEVGLPFPDENMWCSYLLKNVTFLVIWPKLDDISLFSWLKTPCVHNSSGLYTVHSGPGILRDACPFPATPRCSVINPCRRKTISSPTQTDPNWVELHILPQGTGCGPHVCWENDAPKGDITRKREHKFKQM